MTTRRTAEERLRAHRQGEARRAAVYVAGHARDVDDARHLLDCLGIDMADVSAARDALHRTQEVGSHGPT